EMEKYIPSDNPSEKDSVFHIGALDWLPNQQAIRWFLNEVWNKVIEQKPEAKFYLAGRNSPAWIKSLHIPGVVVEGEVPDAISFMNAKEIMVVPLLSGSGVRIKIIEGL